MKEVRKKMLPIFEVPEILTVDGNPFTGELSNSGAGLGPGKGCTTGCNDGCCSGCYTGGGDGEEP